MAREDWYILDAAKAYCRETHYNKEKSDYFKAGVKWTVERFLKCAKPDHGPYNLDSGTKAYLRSLDIKDIKKFCEEAMKITISEIEETKDQN